MLHKIKACAFFESIEVPMKTFSSDHSMILLLFYDDKCNESIDTAVSLYYNT